MSQLCDFEKVLSHVSASGPRIWEKNDDENAYLIGGQHMHRRRDMVSEYQITAALTVTATVIIIMSNNSGGAFKGASELSDL